MQNVELTEYDFIHSYNEQSDKMDDGYPRSIKDNFPGMRERDGDEVDEVDAATYKNGKEAFFMLGILSVYIQCCALVWDKK